MKSKMTLLVIAISVVTVFAFGLSMIPKSFNQVEAQGMMNSFSNHSTNRMVKMMRWEGRNQMLQMMRDHHGTNHQLL